MPLLVALVAGWGCGDDDDDGTASDADTDADADTDTDADSDTDTDTDADTDTDTDADLTWVTIPGGTFQMGSTEGLSDELPVHPVTVPSFEMTQTEVTVAQYAGCVTASMCTAPSTEDSICNWNAAGYEDHPVNCVDWSQAVAFCQWAGARLPSEAEWEYAARSGGQDITYPWGNETATCDYAVMSEEGSEGCGTDRTWAVCSKTAGNTDQGLCDMAGNVWEWVRDWYHSDYTGAPADGSAWEDPVGSYRVLRGCCFVAGAFCMRTAYRLAYDPSVQAYGLGFRCAR
jgi:iron(II)-dependent oxidoreductase